VHDFCVWTSSNAIGVESECSAAYLQSPLSKVRIDDGAELRVLDQLQQYEANILVRHTYAFFSAILPLVLIAISNELSFSVRI
jgi:hypothetical protein